MRRLLFHGLGVEDMIDLQDLHEGSLLYNIRLRYTQSKIYTYTVGHIRLVTQPTCFASA